MRIREPLRALLRRCWPAGRERTVGIVALGIVLLAGLTLSRTITSFSQKAFASSWRLREVGLHVNPFRTRHALLDSGLPIYDLKIKASEMRKIDGIVAEARRRGGLEDDLKQWSQATMVHEGESRRVKVRIRGDLPVHWEGERKSWRVRFRKGEPLDGRRQLNFIVTADSKGLSEYFTNSVFQSLGLLTLRDEYGILRINGVPQGVYYIVEHPTASLLANRQRTESAVYSRPVGMFREQVTDGDTLALPALQALRDYEDDPTEARFRAAVAVTDMEDYVRFAAGTTLFGSDHTYLAGDNHRLYYDASRGQFSRIPWDILPRRLRTPARTWLNRHLSAVDLFEVFPMSEFRKRVLQSDVFGHERNKVLWDLVKDDGVLRMLDERFSDLALPLWADVQGVGDEVQRIATLRRTVQHNIEHIRRCLSINRARVRVRREDDRTASLRISVENLSGMTLREIRMDQPEGGRGSYTLYRDSNDDGVFDSGDARVGSCRVASRETERFELDDLMRPRMRVEENVMMNVQSGGEIRFETIVYPVSRRHHYFLVRGSDAPWPVVSVVADNAVTKRRFEKAAIPLRSFLTDNDYDPTVRNASMASFLTANDEFVADPEDDRAVTFRDRRTRLDRVVVVPEGVRVRIRSGTTLDMGTGASLICFGAIRAKGTAEAPIRIRSSAAEAWGTVASVGAHETSLLEHVYVSGGGGAVRQGIVFTGGVAVHNGDVTVASCRFTNMPAEDALNVKDGEVTLRDTYFGDNAGDGADLDFVSGSVRGCHFVGHEGDAIDVSGADVTVADCRIERSVDKGISVGEASDVSVVNTLLLENAIGVAVKDSSDATVEHCTLLGNATSIAAYRKKPVFGGGEAVVRRCVLVESESPVTFDTWSSVRLTSSVTPSHYQVGGCTVARPHLSDDLRSHHFVCNLAPRSAVADRVENAPGLRAPPIDLR